MDLDTGIEQMIAAGTEQDALTQRMIAHAEVALERRHRGTTSEASRSRASCAYIEAVVVAASFGPGVHERFITPSRLIPVYRGPSTSSFVVRSPAAERTSGGGSR